MCAEVCTFGAHKFSFFTLQNVENTKKINENHPQIPQKFLGAFGGGHII